jgi:hypothetical protein
MVLQTGRHELSLDQRQPDRRYLALSDYRIGREKHVILAGDHDGE